AVARGCEDLFQAVAGPLDHRGTDRARRPLEAVRRPEQLLEAVRLLGPAAPLLQGEQVLVQRADVLPQFLQERPPQPPDKLPLVHRLTSTCANPASGGRHPPVATPRRELIRQQGADAPRSPSAGPFGQPVRRVSWVPSRLRLSAD